MWKKGISGLLWGLAIVMVYSVLFGRTISGYKTGVNKTVSVMAGEEAHFVVIDSGHGFSMRVKSVSAVHWKRILIWPSR